MHPQEKAVYERFIETFHERYKDELMHAGLVPEAEVRQLYFEFKASGKTPEQWFEQQELS